ncbi:endonuclease/exonuclease/phosphatase family protein [Natronoflexus pectinivorans]|uniref:endonuclease/exonuclease/phosphatase family protein n=1 Tax=Natronoflexus pectinivorans TaxID=682526 RepID=UPI00104C988C|nr:endonuclease/exonuclease/phosphatase family protein [Natronoflexus pectinivorans]
MKKLIYSISLIIVFIPAALLLLSVLTAYVSPARLHIFAFAGFAFPVFWLLNLVILGWLLIRKSLLSLIPFVVLAISLQHWNNTFQFRAKTIDNIQQLERPVTIMSYNTRMFDFYKHSGMDGAPEAIFEYILRKDPDIICFQEYFTSMRRDEYTPTAIIAKFRKYGYRQVDYLRTHRGNTGYGLAIFSKHPIVNGNAIRFENSLNMASYADINVDGKVIRVFNTHLESIGFQDHELSVLDSLDFRMTDSQRQGLRNISQKITRAFKSRSSQAEFLARHIENSPYPVIVCGDFNDTPVSYVYRTMRGNLKDAFRESGVGFGGTYNGRLPSFRIDYIFHDPQFESFNFERLPLDYSDHFPIMTTIDLKQ